MSEMADDLATVLKFLMDNKADENVMRAFDIIRRYITLDILKEWQRSMCETEIQ